MYKENKPHCVMNRGPQDKLLGPGEGRHFYRALPYLPTPAHIRK